MTLKFPRLNVRIICIVMLLTMLALVIIGFSFWAMSIAGSRMAKAHTAPSGWSYPLDCCHNMDCAPVEHYSYDPVTQLIVIRTKHGVVAVGVEEVDKKKRDSGDGSTHACIVPKPEGGGFTLRCLFLPKGV